MKILFITLLCFSNQLFSQQTQHQDVEEVVVYGICPGPELWRVSNGDNELWILATLPLLPKKMVWHSQLVEAVIEDAQVLLLPPSASADIGFFKQLSLVPSLIGIQKNPDGKTLQQVLPAEIYARWLLLKEKYMGKDKGVEKTRPIFASQQLFNAAIEKSDLVYDTTVRKKIRKLAKKNKLEFITPTIKLDFDKPKKSIKQFKKSEIDDLACFTATLDRLEQDLNNMIIRANAWANGDIGKIKQLTYPNQEAACGQAFLNSDVVQDTDMKDIIPRLIQAWVDAASESLQKNKSTFAYLSINSLIGENNILEALAAQGYHVQEPK